MQLFCLCRYRSRLAVCLHASREQDSRDSLEVSVGLPSSGIVSVTTSVGSVGLDPRPGEQNWIGTTRACN